MHNFSLKQLIWLFIILILAGISGEYYVNQQLNHPIQRKPKGLPTDTFYQFTITSFNQAGNIDKHLIGNKLERFVDSDTILINKPTLTLHQRKNKVTIVTAETATSKQNKVITLKQNVVIKEYSKKPKKLLTTLETEKLDYLPNSQYLITNQPVTVKQPNTIIHSIGMQANLKTDTIEFLKQTQIDYEAS